MSRTSTRAIFGGLSQAFNDATIGAFLWLKFDWEAARPHRRGGRCASAPVAVDYKLAGVACR